MKMFDFLCLQGQQGTSVTRNRAVLFENAISVTDVIIQLDLNR